MLRHRLVTTLTGLTLLLTALTATIAVPASVSPRAAAVGPDCGPTIAKPDGGVWQCVFADPFTGRRLDTTKWSVLTSLHSATVKTECRVDSPDNVRVLRGTLRLTARKLRNPVLCRYANGVYTTPYTAGAVSTGLKFSRTFGRFEVRAKFPGTTVSGLHSAIWMWPQHMRYGVRSGEIDIAEYRTGTPGRVVPTLHYERPDGSTMATMPGCTFPHPEYYHTYAVEWTRTTMTFLYDGEVCWTHTWNPAAPLTRPAPFDEPYFMILNQSIANESGINKFIEGVTPLPATMQVDYVRAWQ